MKGKHSVLPLVVLLSFSSVVLAGTPLDTVKENVDGVLDILRNPKLKGPTGKKVKEDKIEAAADKLFDFVELSKRTLGLYWNRFTPDQRKEFVSLFTKLLRNVYVDRITSYSNEPVTFAREVPLAQNIVEVRSVVTMNNGDVPINYRVIKKDDEWKVFDVVIEGVSLVEDYRTQFREILGNNPPEELLKTLREKVGKQQKLS